MSMNLTLHDGEDGPKIELWQTPTWVTWICLSYNPETKESDGGNEGVRRRYEYWVRSHLNGVWKETEEFKTAVHNIFMGYTAYIEELK